MPHNRLRALPNAGEPSVGTHLLSSWPTLVELIGNAGILDEWCRVNGEDIRGLLAGPPSAAAPKQTAGTCEAGQ